MIPHTLVKFCGKYPVNVLDFRAAKHNFEIWHKELLDVMMADLTPDDVLYDAGAEEGEFSALAATRVGGDRVHLFEPSFGVWPNIRAVWEVNNLAQPGTFMGFAGDVTSLGENPPGWPACAYGPLQVESRFSFIEERPDIQRTTIDDYAKTHQPPTALLIDVEGAEHLVLKGAVNALHTTVRSAFVSVHYAERLAHYGTSEPEIIAWMEAQGFTTNLILREHETHYHFARK
jgi:FkbM family methyltransferase